MIDIKDVISVLRASKLDVRIDINAPTKRESDVMQNLMVVLSRFINDYQKVVESRGARRIAGELLVLVNKIRNPSELKITSFEEGVARKQEANKMIDDFVANLAAIPSGAGKEEIIVRDRTYLASMALLKLFILGKNFTPHWGIIADVADAFYNTIHRESGFDPNKPFVKMIPELNYIHESGNKDQISEAEYADILKKMSELFRSWSYHGLKLENGEYRVITCANENGFRGFGSLYGSESAIKNKSKENEERIYLNINPKHIYDVLLIVIQCINDIVKTKYNLPANTGDFYLKGKVPESAGYVDRPDTIVLYLRGDNLGIRDEFKQYLISKINACPEEFSNNQSNFGAVKDGYVSLAPEPTMPMMQKIAKLGWKYACKGSAGKFHIPTYFLPGQKCPICGTPAKASYGQYVSFAFADALIRLFPSLKEFFPFDETKLKLRVNQELGKIKIILTREWGLTI